MNVACVVDNTARRHSGFWGEQGLAFLIETKSGRLLFDCTGERAYVALVSAFGKRVSSCPAGTTLGF